MTWHDENWHKRGTTEWVLIVTARHKHSRWRLEDKTIGSYGTFDQAKQAAAEVLPSTEAEHDDGIVCAAEVDKVVWTADESDGVVEDSDCSFTGRLNGNGGIDWEEDAY